jgi:hypothetical protein
MNVKRRTVHLDFSKRRDWEHLVPDGYKEHAVDAKVTVINVYLFRNFWRLKTIKYMILRHHYYTILRPENYPILKDRRMITLYGTQYIESDNFKNTFIQL